MDPEERMLLQQFGRERYLKSNRRAQPLDELRRKAAKAKTRSNIHTQEELDLAVAEAITLIASLRLE